MPVGLGPGAAAAGLAGCGRGGSGGRPCTEPLQPSAGSAAGAERRAGSRPPVRRSGGRVQVGHAPSLCGCRAARGGERRLPSPPPAGDCARPVVLRLSRDRVGDSERTRQSSIYTSAHRPSGPGPGAPGPGSEPTGCILGRRHSHGDIVTVTVAGPGSGSRWHVTGMAHRDHGSAVTSLTVEKKPLPAGRLGSVASSRPTRHRLDDP